MLAAGGSMASRGCLLSLGVFSLWMLTSFLCHKLAKMALNVCANDTTSPPSLLPPLLVTLFQMLTCYACVNLTSSRLFRIMAASQLLATLATNCSFALTFASSTMAIKMLEPITSALLQTFMFQTPMGVDAVLGMVVVVSGSVLYVGNPLGSENDLVRAVTLALLSNVTLGLRNVAIKLSQSGSSNKTSFRPVTTIVAFAMALVLLLCGVYVSEKAFEGLFAYNASSFVSLSLASSIFHVTYSYISTNLVLRYMSVVGHALANIFKRVLVVLLLHVSGRRVASVSNWLGLALCTLGLLLYNRKKLLTSGCGQSLSSATDKTTGTSEQKERSGVSPGGKRRQLSCLLASFTLVFIICCTVPAQTLTTHTYIMPQNPQLAFTKPFNTKEFVSEVIATHPQPKNRSENDYLSNLRYGHLNWTDGKPLLLAPVKFQPARKSSHEIMEFLSRENLTSTPYDTDVLSPYLSSSREIIAEAQRVHFNLFKELFRGKKYCVLLELASHENKGDSALSVGEILLLETMGVEVVSYVDVNQCNQTYYRNALSVIEKYSAEEVMVLLHGGGNIFGYPQVDRCRERALRNFRNYQVVMFSQSIYMRSSHKHFVTSYKLYCCNPRLTILLRDRLSLQIARRLFTGGTRLLLAPDMAFQIGHVDRFAPPYYDVIWQRRKDAEAPRYANGPQSFFPKNVTVWEWDWLKMYSLKSNSSLRKAINVMQHGLAILQRGRVVVTDRLHGHILSTLLDIPHVMLDNSDQKLSSYHNTWTRGLSNCRLTDNVKDAARSALELLELYKDSLPKRLRAADIDGDI